MDEILDFIDRRFASTDANWLNGNCYWFAHILCSRFNYLDLYYEPIIGHFYAGYNNQYYDWTGMVKPQYSPILLSKIEKEDILWYNHIIRDCVL